MANEELWLALKLQIDDVQDKLNTITSQGKQTASTLGTSFNSLKPIMAAVFGVGSIIALTAKVKQFASESITAFADSEYSAMALDNTLKNIGISETGITSVESMVNQLEKLTSFDDTEIRGALSNAVIKLGDLDLATKTVQVSMEVARAKNISLTDAVQRLSLGLMGNSRGLKDLGINIKDFGEGTLTAQQQMNILDTVLGKVGGSVDKFSTTVKGKLEEQKTAWGNFKEAVGGALAEFTKMNADLVTSKLDKITNSLNEMEKAAEDTKNEIIELDIYTGLPLVTGIKKAAISANDFYNEIKDIYMVSKDAGGEIKDVGDAIKSAFEPLWKPITLQGGNLPELSRFVGNLKYATPIITRKSVIDVNINVNDKTTGGKTTGTIVGTTTGYFYAHQIAMQIKKEMEYESHGTGGG
jgi:hypothetical protein